MILFMMILAPAPLDRCFAYLSAVGGGEVVVSPVELSLGLFTTASLQSQHSQGPSGNISFLLIEISKEPSI